VQDSNPFLNPANGFWFQFAGPRIDYIATSNVSDGWIYSYGQQWWDLNPANGTGITGRPHLFSFNTTNGTMQHFKSMKPIGWNVQLSMVNP